MSFSKISRLQTDNINIYMYLWFLMKKINKPKVKSYRIYTPILSRGYLQAWLPFFSPPLFIG